MLFNNVYHKSIVINIFITILITRLHRQYLQTKKSSVVASSTPHSNALPHQIYIQNVLSKLTIRHTGRYRSGISKTNFGNGPRCVKIEIQGNDYLIINIPENRPRTDRDNDTHTNLTSYSTDFRHCIESVGALVAFEVCEVFVFA